MLIIWILYEIAAKVSEKSISVNLVNKCFHEKTAFGSQGLKHLRNNLLLCVENMLNLFQTFTNCLLILYSIVAKVWVKINQLPTIKRMSSQKQRFVAKFYNSFHKLLLVLSIYIYIFLSFAMCTKLSKIHTPEIKFPKKTPFQSNIS